MRVLCLSAHPDDEVLGLGGTLLRHRDAGHEIHWVVATVAYPPRWTDNLIHAKRQECERVAQKLRIRQTSFLDYKTMHLATLPPIELSEAVALRVRQIKPDIVYAPPCDDLNRDHAALFDAALIATRPTGDPKPPCLYSYEIPSTTRFNLPNRWQANTYIDIGPWIDEKLQLMSIYETELQQPPHPRSLDSLRAFARERGAAVGYTFAEALMLVRACRPAETTMASPGP